MPTPSISVIVPAYNAEDYLPACLDSITSQDIEETFEIVCINDGSTDSTADILDKYDRNYPYLKVITQKNSGLSAARNAGIKTSSGDYIMFVDSDDAILEGTLRAVYTKAHDEDLDVLFYDGKTIFDNPQLEIAFPGNKDAFRKKNSYLKPTDGISLFETFIDNYDYQPSACLQLISRKHLIDNNLLFPAGLLYEDNIFTLSSLLKANAAGHLKRDCYIRYVHADSITTRVPEDENIRCAYVVLRKVIDILNSADLDRHGRACGGKEVARLIDQIEYLYDLMPEGSVINQELFDPIDYVLLQEVLDIRKQRHEIWSTQGTIDDLSTKLQKREEKIASLNKELSDVYSSKSLRIGRAVTALPRRLRNLLRHN